MPTDIPHATRGESAIRTVACPDCYVCGRAGNALYKEISDRVYNIPGQWMLKRCPGPDCGHVWLDPIPIREDIPKLYETYLTHAESNTHSTPLAERAPLHSTSAAYLATRYNYPKKTEGFGPNLLSVLGSLRPRRRVRLDLSMFYLNYVPGGRLLDIGCGNGPLLRQMKDIGWDPQGIDFDAKAVNAARATGVKVQHGAVEDQHFPDDHFDAIAMNHVIEHFDDPRSVLRECRRILKPGGQIVIVTPNARSLGHRLYGQSWFPLEPPRHLHIFTLASLARLVEDEGLRVVSGGSAWIHAAAFFVGSRSIARSGRYEMGTGLEGKSLRWAERRSTLEAILMLVAPELGEELVLKIGLN